MTLAATQNLLIAIIASGIYGIIFNVKVAQSRSAYWAGGDINLQNYSDYISFDTECWVRDSFLNICTTEVSTANNIDKYKVTDLKISFTLGTSPYESVTVAFEPTYTLERDSVNPGASFSDYFKCTYSEEQDELIDGDNIDLRIHITAVSGHYAPIEESENEKLF